MKLERRMFLSSLFSASAACARASAVREAAVAGSFYPASAGELTAMVDGFVAGARLEPVKDVIALVAPHAGYPFSGPVAGHAYAQLKGRKFARVVVIAPSHYDAFRFVSLYDGSAYRTPLGSLEVERRLIEQLSDGDRLRRSSRGHAVSPQQQEHAIEVQLPFLQRTLGGFMLVPVVMGSQDYESCRALGVALSKHVSPADTLIVASSDLSHYHPYAQAVALDRQTLGGVSEFDFLSLSRNLEGEIWEACGGGPIVAAMIAAARLGANQATLLRYQNSGDTSGEKGRVVGYGAVALHKTAAAAEAAAFQLSDAEKRELLRLARRSVESAVSGQKAGPYPLTGSEQFTRQRGAFVTLRKHGELRGCVGFTSPIKPLPLVVREVAAYAALEDRRFRPVAKAELPELEYEISVLSPLRHVLDVNTIEVGRHGLVMLQGRREGLLLPQVAPEQGWNRDEFLRQTCLKAGLPPEAWRDPATDIFRFTALVFGDKDVPR